MAIKVAKSKYEHCYSCNATEDLIDITCRSALNKRMVLVIPLCGKCRLELMEKMSENA